MKLKQRQLSRQPELKPLPQALQRLEQVLQRPRLSKVSPLTVDLHGILRQQIGTMERSRMLMPGQYNMEWLCRMGN